MNRFRKLIAECRTLLERSGPRLMQSGNALIVQSTKISRAGQDGMSKLKRVIDKNELKLAVAAKAERDGANEFHITLLNPQECAAVANLKDRMAKFEVEEDWSIEGVGAVEKADTKAFFIVVNWPSGRKFRKSLGFEPKKDFHITLGFTKSDVHDVPKNRDTLISK